MVFRDGKSTTTFVIFSKGLTFWTLRREKNPTQYKPNQPNNIPSSESALFQAWISVDLIFSSSLFTQ